MNTPWICSQLGAREHYAVPRALESAGLLEHLITEFWAPPGSLPSLPFLRRMQDRCAQLPGISPRSWNFAALRFEAVNRLRGLDGWSLILKRNLWFQRRAAQFLRDLDRLRPARQRCIFSYSYTAFELFQVARQAGWTTVLGQIDPGPEEERIVAGLHREYPGEAGPWTPAPAAYWESWAGECRLADHILVNSAWSREALIRNGVSAEKILVAPLAYEPPSDAAAFTRAYPRRFTTGRPLRTLFLGQANLRKGIGVLFEVMARMQKEPVEFRIVGPIQVPVPAALRRQANVRFFGPVPRTQAAGHYRDADVFLFPTFSDGFGLTQLEAQAWKLPVIASLFCGNVIEHMRNGVLLPQVAPDTLEDAIRRCLDDPALLARMAAASSIPPRFTLAALGRTLAGVAASGPFRAGSRDASHPGIRC